ncbi:hypothetical protein ASG94_08415 [Nocardioides sp. Soil805]|nr:hypothetical protein ASG94_08415 [Nocardioides sp. Soil805]
MTDAQPNPVLASTIAVSVHGPAGVLDLVVPEGATSVDVAREYAAQTGVAGIPLLQTPLGELLTADRTLASAGVGSGAVLVATTGVHRTRPRDEDQDRTDLLADTPAFAAVVMGLAAAAAALAAWYAAQAADDALRTTTVGLLMVCALASTLPLGRHAAQRAAAAPAFGAAAAFAAVHEPGVHLLPAVVAVSAVSAGVIAAVALALGPDRDEALQVWIVAGLVVFAVCGITPLLEWDGRVAWAVLVLVAMLAARFVPSLAIDVPDETLIDLDRLAVTAWSARDGGRAGRGRIVVSAAAMRQLVAGATRTVTAACAAIMVTAVVATPLLLATATIDLDRIGARALAFFAGASILLAARSYRHTTARRLLRVGGLACWLWLLGFLVGDVSPTAVLVALVVLLLLGGVCLAAAVATGRGWRSVWWSRRAELAEGLCGSFAFAATVVASGFFRSLWEITS